MENKNVGYLIIGIAITLIFIVFLFNSALKEIVSLGCSAEHGTSCPMYKSVNQQTYLALSIVGILILIGLFLIFSKQPETIIIKKVKEKIKKKKLDTSKLSKDEKELVNLLVKENKAMFQADLKEKLEIGKVKLTRLLDKLEDKNFIERKRRGMNNLVILKD